MIEKKERGKIGIVFGFFDFFHAGHVLMFQEAKEVCDFLIVCIQAKPEGKRIDKEPIVQNIVERQIQIKACRYVDDIFVFTSDEEVMEILDVIDWDIRIQSDEYFNKDFCGREETFGRCYFTHRTGIYSSTKIRKSFSNNL